MHVEWSANHGCHGLLANVWEASNERLIGWWIGTEGARENAALLREEGESANGDKLILFLCTTLGW